MRESLADQLATTALYGGNADFIEDLYEQFLKNPASVDPGWAGCFEVLRAEAAAGGPGAQASHRQIRERPPAIRRGPPAPNRRRCHA
jgi:2-oxoglutarate dehydrogenase complex dehydrogenase (E1) component-like enzyme